MHGVGGVWCVVCMVWVVCGGWWCAWCVVCMVWVVCGVHGVGGVPGVWCFTHLSTRPDESEGVVTLK